MYLIWFLFDVNQSQQHKTNLSLIPPLALCLLHIITHSSCYCCPLIELSKWQNLYVFATAVNKNRIPQQTCTSCFEGIGGKSRNELCQVATNMCGYERKTMMWEKVQILCVFVLLMSFCYSQFGEIYCIDNIYTGLVDMVKIAYIVFKVVVDNRG